MGIEQIFESPQHSYKLYLAIIRCTATRYSRAEFSLNLNAHPKSLSSELVIATIITTTIALRLPVPIEHLLRPIAEMVKLKLLAAL